MIRRCFSTRKNSTIIKTEHIQHYLRPRETPRSLRTKNQSRNEWIFAFSSSFFLYLMKDQITTANWIRANWFVEFSNIRA